MAIDKSKFLSIGPSKLGEVGELDSLMKGHTAFRGDSPCLVHPSLPVSTWVNVGPVVWPFSGL